MHIICTKYAETNRIYESIRMNTPEAHTSGAFFVLNVHSVHTKYTPPSFLLYFKGEGREFESRHSDQFTNAYE